MAFVAFMKFPGITPDQYDRLVLRLGLDEQPAPGQILHIGAEFSEGFEACDVWMTREAAERYLDDRLRPAMLDAGIRTHPEMRLVPLHNAFVPELEMLARMGATSLPAVEAHILR